MSDTRPAPSRLAEVFIAFLKLGLTSFGGPIAHLGYFRTEFVEKRKWLGEQDYASLVGVCQFLPGPASSQVGFALGMMRAGPVGAGAAWIAFTLPSVIIMTAFALGAGAIDGVIGQGVLLGLKLVAVAIIAHAVLGMSQSLCPDKTRAGIALLAVFMAVFIGGAVGQVGAILLGGVLGYLLCKSDDSNQSSDLHMPVSKTAGNLALMLFLTLLLGLPLLAFLAPSPLIDFLDAFYRAGALVFGGGHVVLPLLQGEVVNSGLISTEEFLAGYGAAQAIPGPLFTFATYLGALMPGELGGLWGALLATVMIFAPGFLLLLAVMPYWNSFRKRENAQAIMRGTNAAVVGILGAALYDPVWSSAVTSPSAFVLALAGFMMLAVWKLAPWVVVLGLSLGGVIIF